MIFYNFLFYTFFITFPKSKFKKNILTPFPSLENHIQNCVIFHFHSGFNTSETRTIKRLNWTVKEDYDPNITKILYDHNFAGRLRSEF